MALDLSTEFGRRVARRLNEERVIWLTTVDRNGTPQPRPVWFWWNGESFLMYSRPGMHKLEQLEIHSKAALHLDSDGRGGDIVVFTGEAHVDPTSPPADKVPAYAEKYRSSFERIHMTVTEFAQTYSVAIRFYPAKLRGH